MFGWIFAIVYLVLLLVFQNWWDQNHSRTWRYDPVRKWRTSRLWLFIKLWIIIALPLYPVMCWVFTATTWNWISGTFLGTLALVIFGAIGTRIIGMAVYPQVYAQLRADGWDPLWDMWWSGLINRDPPEVRAGQPPACINASNWAPPTNWAHQCPNCGAKQPGPWFWCWNCKLGYEDGCQKLCCGNCNTTFKEASPGAGRVEAISCPGCGQAWFMPSYVGPDHTAAPSGNGNGVGRLPIDVN